ncbi:MAG: SH3 domain-containing C40 family peptidase [Eubacterium sp.]|nr:SH3 domain-containing C40 family peptidase [Eubacterium sp.]
MNRSRLIRAVLGAGCIMSLGLLASVVTSRSTTMGSETELAGMSYTLDMFCSLQSGVGSDPEAIVAFADMLGGNAASGTSVTGDALVDEQSVDGEVKSASEYENVGISIAADYVNIRKRPDTEAEIVGKLYRGSAATIVRHEGDWAFIKSGSVEGYIRKDYLAIGYSAEKLIDEFGTKWATVTTETLRVREDSNESADVITLVSEGESYPVVKELSDWAKINVDDDCIGYVSKDYVKITVQFKKAVSIEEEREEQRRKEAARAAENDNNNNGDNGGNGGNNASNGGGHSNNGGGNGSGGGNGGNSNGGNGGGHGNGGNSGGGGGNSGGGSGGGGGGHASDDSGGGGGGGSDDDGNTLAEGDGEAVAAYGLQFVGNPYVYGGTSLTHGTDCSGFTMSVFRHFGINLPRTSSSQSTVGKRISWRDARAGDLIFYGSGGHVSHVALCIGGGRVVHASNARTGIKTSPIDYRTPITARRVLG